MSTLNLSYHSIAFDDEVPTNNPQARNWDEKRQLHGIIIENPCSNVYKLPPLGSLSIFDGSRTLGLNASTSFNLRTLFANGIYRLSWAGAGASPAFRTDRGLTLSGGTLTITQQLNESVVITHSSGAVFGSVVIGDTVFIPGVATGDTGPFDPLNQGDWSVLYATATALTLVRFPGKLYSGKAESVAVTSNSQVQAFSSDGVQEDDTLQLKTSFPNGVIGSYSLYRVTASTLEFYSGNPLPQLTSVVPGASSMVIHSEAKAYTCIETNQDIGLFINGSVSEIPVEPFIAGTKGKEGRFELKGTIYSLSITNRSTQIAIVTIRSAE